MPIDRQKFIDTLKAAQGSVTRKLTAKEKEQIEDAKEVFELIKFPCQFSDWGCSGDSNSPKACCSECDRNVGYLHHVPEDEVDYYASMYDEVDGFWKKGKGCTLPASKRSARCLTYYCDYITWFENDPKARKQIKAIDELLESSQRICIGMPQKNKRER